ncbi:HD domain-containing protein [Bacillus sp. B1-b2]|uniref:HD domain-containing protein n=1 Tax=Bacillus sp. B1-b2 TaxID=2653201 RepID=UPI00126254C8|nr:HD domain-containing protein [Bacillus sp. B1-b2]KAB7673005.1 HD domain-containing protein [Bacillus sp. B1-b2]
MNIIAKTEAFVKNQLAHDTTGHDWYHINRVRNLAIFIGEKEASENIKVIELAALLHDIADEKLNESKQSGERKLIQYLEQLSIGKEEKEQILSIISTVGFKGGNGVSPESLEAKIVQDADRLDAIGAIGIARTFAYGGHKGSPIFDPELKSRTNMTVEEYRNEKSSSIHHFYEKLLKLQNLLHTETAKRIASKRHQYMEMYLEEFYKEWNGDYEKYFD